MTIPRKLGPTCIPCDFVPTNPALYGRYIVVDLDENNRYSRAAYHERFPERELPSFGFGVCRHGFGLQELGDGYMDEKTAEARAKALNAGQPATSIHNK